MRNNADALFQGVTEQSKGASREERVEILEADRPTSFAVTAE